MLDLRTLALVTSVTGVIFCLSTLVLWRLLPQQRSLGTWALAALFIGSGTLLVAGRGVIPDTVSITVGNSSIAFGLGLVYLGSRQLFGLETGRRWLVGVLAMTVLCAALFAFFLGSLPARLFLSSLFTVPYFVGAAVVFWRDGGGFHLKAISRFTAVFFAVGVVIYTVRGVGALRMPLSLDFGTTPSMMVALPYLYGIVFDFWLSIMLTMTVSSQIQQQLVEARDLAEAASRELAVLSVTDRLTQLFNRGRLDDVLKAEVARADRYENPLSIIMLDLDNFKRVNDAYGHPTGDVVLVRVAEIMKAQLRSTDTIGRWGGEEFLIVLPQTDEKNAFQVAEKIRLATEAALVVPEGEMTASFGVTEFRAGDSPARIVNRADAALYEAKRSGRNLVVTS